MEICEFMVTKKIKETVDFQVEFYDVDSMQVAWHGNYVKFMEVARCALLKKKLGMVTMK